MKRLISVLLAVLLIIACATSASAASVDLTDSGKTVVILGDWVYEKINNDTQYELDEYVGSGGEVIVPRFFGDYLIVALGDHCFMNNETVTSVITSSPLWTIGEYCFIDCTALESIELNYALHTIETGAFSGASALKNINLEDSIVTQIAPDTFLNSGIENIALPETCTELCKDSFAQCENLSKVEIPDSVTTIHEDAFRDSDNVVIYAKRDSYAIAFAKAHDIPYVETDYKTVTYIIGDADDDGEVTILDATKIQRVLVDLDQDSDGMIALRGHTDPDDDELNIMDATRIQRWLVNFEVDANFGEEVTTEIHIA